jgi:indolepyruvate ferredoxin oxidoreductase
MNLAAFEWGRRAAFDLAAAEAAAGIAARRADPTLAEIVARRAEFLTSYQNARYADRYRARVASIASAEERAVPGSTALATEVAHSLFKLMAIKDEYEVARLYADGSFERQLKDQFAAWDKLEFHLAPPLLAKRDKRTGHLKKQSFGSWMTRAFQVLAHLRFLRGTILDPFAGLAERRWERQLLADYEATLDTIESNLSAANLDAAVALAAYPRKIRGYGHVKEAQARPALAERERLLKAFMRPETVPLAEAAE